MVDPAAREVEVFINPVPLLGVKLAAGEEVDGGAEGNRYVCYHKAVLVRRKRIVNSIWEDVETVVEEEEEEENQKRENAELDAGSNLLNESAVAH